MSTMSELVAQGVSKMRLPFWNPHAYAIVPPDGPWAYIYDVLATEPMPWLISECDEHTNWEPIL